MTKTLSLLAALLALSLSAARAAEEPKHPLDALTAGEIDAAVEILRKADHVDDDTRFPHVMLDEPAKDEVLAWKEGEPFARRAFVVAKKGKEAFEAVVDLRKKKIAAWRPISGAQPSILLEEFQGVGDIVREDETWQAAVRKRGFEKFDEIFCMPLSAGYYAVPDESKRRLVRAACFDGGSAKNYWGRPIEGVTAIVDLNEKKVVRVDDEGVVPMATSPADFDDETVGKLRKSSEMRVEQPGGPGFAVDGGEVRWDRWRFHLRSDPRAGLVVSLASFEDGGAKRPVLYQGFLSEIFVPYQDPSLGWYFRTYMDEGEYGVGKLATTLVEGSDCPSHAAYLGDVLADDRGKPVERPRITCLFERQSGDPSWRHYDFVADTTDSRRSRELVVRQVAAVGNYDYVFDWVFREDGSIRVAVGATGVAEVKGVEPKTAKDPGGKQAAAYGRYVAENLVAVNHDHFLCYRLDLDVDGPKNRFVTDVLTAKNPGKGRRKSIWTAETKTLKREKEARLHSSMTKPAQWRVENAEKTGVGGDPVSYQLHPGHNAMNLLSEDDHPSQRAGFAAHELWVTRHAPGERWAGGDYPNQSPGGAGLPAWTKANRSIEDEDVVLWYTVGFHHVVRPEDWPVMPTSWHEFELRPFGFFERNPALDVQKK